MSENELRKHVNRLRRECIPIGSSSNGYYFAETAAEVYESSLYTSRNCLVV